MTDAPADVLRQLNTEERVLWHARPRLLRLRTHLLRVLLLGTISALLAWMGQHSMGTIYPGFRVLWYLILLILPLSEFISTLWYIFTTRQTHYTLTTHRAIVSRGSQLEEYPLYPDMLAQIRHRGNDCASVFFFLETRISLVLEYPLAIGRGFADTPQAESLLQLLAEHAGATHPRQEAADEENRIRTEKLKQQGRKSKLVMGITVCVIGLAVLASSIGDLCKNSTLLQDGSYTTGIVLAAYQGREIDVRGIKVGKSIEVEILIRDGDTTFTHTQSCYNGADKRYFTPGATLPMVYRDTPATARIAAPWELYRDSIWNFILSMILLLPGACVLIAFLRAKKELKHLPNS